MTQTLVAVPVEAAADHRGTVVVAAVVVGANTHWMEALQRRAFHNVAVFEVVVVAVVVVAVAAAAVEVLDTHSQRVAVADFGAAWRIVEQRSSQPYSLGVADPVVGYS